MLAIVNGKNEQEFGFLRDQKPEVMKLHWLDFLKRRYGGSLEKYNGAWGTSAKSWDEVKVFSYGKQPSAKAAARDVEAFKLERTTEMWKVV